MLPASLTLPGVADRSTFDQQSDEIKQNTMKTLKTITAALLVTISLSAFADNKPTAKIKTSFNTPAMNWGNPEDVNTSSVESLKNLNRVSSPEMIWGNPEDVKTNSVEFLKEPMTISVPEMIWGNPEDVNSSSIEALNNDKYFAAPEMVWTDIMDFDLASVELLKQITE